MELWQLSAREQIRDAIATYTHCGDRGLIAELAGLFAPTGVLEIKKLWTAVGPAEIAARLGARAEPGLGSAPLLTRHMISNVRFDDLTAEQARVTSYFVVFTEKGADHWGRYRDELVPLDGSWRFSRRTVRVDATVPGSWLAALSNQTG